METFGRVSGAVGRPATAWRRSGVETGHSLRLPRRFAPRKDVYDLVVRELSVVQRPSTVNCDDLAGDEFCGVGH